MQGNNEEGLFEGGEHQVNQHVKQWFQDFLRHALNQSSIFVSGKTPLGERLRTQFSDIHTTSATGSSNSPVPSARSVTVEFDNVMNYDIDISMAIRQEYYRFEPFLTESLNVVFKEWIQNQSRSTNLSKIGDSEMGRGSTPTPHENNSTIQLKFVNLPDMQQYVSFNFLFYICFKNSTIEKLSHWSIN